MAGRKEIEAKPTGYFRTLFSLLLPRRQISIFFAEYQGKRLAAALVVYFGRRATYFFGGSLALHRSIMAPHLLHFEIMRSAKARGCEWYDLWGFAPENEVRRRCAAPRADSGLRLRRRGLRRLRSSPAWR
jgi:hypothetical protein